jgi:hypothetical protein
MLQYAAQEEHAGSVVPPPEQSIPPLSVPKEASVVRIEARGCLSLQAGQSACSGIADLRVLPAPLCALRVDVTSWNYSAVITAENTSCLLVSPTCGENRREEGRYQRSCSDLNLDVPTSRGRGGSRCGERAYGRGSQPGLSAAEERHPPLRTDICHRARSGSSKVGKKQSLSFHFEKCGEARLPPRTSTHCDNQPTSFFSLSSSLFDPSSGSAIRRAACRRRRSNIIMFFCLDLARGAPCSSSSSLRLSCEGHSGIRRGSPRCGEYLTFTAADATSRVRVGFSPHTNLEAPVAGNQR